MVIKKPMQMFGLDSWRSTALVEPSQLIRKARVRVEGVGEEWLEIFVSQLA